MEEKYRNFGEFKSYRKFSLESLWNKGLNPKFLRNGVLQVSFGAK